MCCICIACIAVYLLFLPPPLLLSDSPDDRCRCPCDRLLRRRPCTPTVELPGKQSHSPLPHIAYCSIFICCTRHMLLLRYCPIQLHSLSLLPLDYFPISYAAYTYIIYTAVDPALC